MQRLHFALFFGLLLAASGALLRSSSSAEGGARRSRPEHDSVQLLLPSAALLVTLDLTAVANSPWGAKALARLAALEATAPKSRRCAIQQFGRVQSLALGVPADSAATSELELGLVAQGRFRTEDVLSCAGELVLARGGDPVRANIGSFSVLRDRAGTYEIAVRDDGPLIVSGGRIFRDLVDRAQAQGTAPRPTGVLEDLHRALRKNAGPAALLASWVLRPGWLERWLGESNLGASPLASVRAVLVQGNVGEDLRLSAELRVEHSDAAERLERFLETLLRDMGLSGEAGAAPVVITRGADHVRIALTTREVDVARWFQRSLLPSVAGSD